MKFLLSLFLFLLAETRCPSGTWRIKNFSEYMKSYATGEYIQSPRFYSPEGYAFGIQLLPNSYYDGYIGAFFHLSTGENDQALEWPAGNRQVTITLLDQDSDVRQRQSFSYSFTTSPTHLIPGMGQANVGSKGHITFFSLTLRLLWRLKLLG